MPIPSVLLLLVLTASTGLIVAHTLHRVRVGRSAVLVPDMDYMSRLEQDLDRIQGTRNEISGAEGSLGARLGALESAVRGAAREGERLSTDHVTRTLLEVRESSEAAAIPHLDGRSPH
ncbi:hypothetical protein [Nocardiopsis eucommiae]|uniref:hypothetical protein n=1 Tax=Nocardiopsis eucommiae TaxID=2831970 RepID=UPI003D71314D